MCYQLGCLWDLQGTWGANFFYGYKRTTFIQSGTNVHDSLIDPMPDYPVGSEIMSITISGSTFSGVLHTSVGDLSYTGTIADSGTRLDGVMDQGGPYQTDFDYIKE